MEAIEFNGKNITIGVLGLLTMLLAGFGGSELLEPEQYENAYYCEVSGELGVFLGGISGTAYTGYPHDYDRKDYERCVDDLGNKGEWVELEKYAKDKGVDLLTFLVQSQEPEPSPEPEPQPQPEPNPDWVVMEGKVWCCNNAGCVPRACTEKEAE